MYKVKIFDVSYSTLKKHQRTPYETFTLGSWEHAKREALQTSEDTGLCVSVQNMETGAIHYFNDGMLVNSI